MRFSRLLAEAQLGPSGPADGSAPAAGACDRQRGIAGVDRIRGEAEVLRVVTDSRRVHGGDCFVAVRGTAADGHTYIPAAVTGGCSAVVCEDASLVPEGVPLAVVGDTRLAAARLGQAVLGWPSRRLTTVGVTGTNGKTTFTFLLRGILEAMGHKVGLFGTICYDVPVAGNSVAPGKSVPASTTTPDPLELAGMMADVLAAGGSHMVMEVSSHALDQRRVAGIDFRVGVFTNLTGDHLDYHLTMEEYLLAKRRLFESLGADGFAVLNRDDPAGERMAAATRARVIWYGLDAPADVSAKVLEMDAGGTSFLLQYQGRSTPVRSRLIGRHNVANCLAAASAALALGAPVEKVAAALGDVANVPGRLQRVPSQAPFQVLVDYAHTDDALVNVLSALRPLTKGRLILVFGCGGDRDRTKRPRMAKVAERWADRIFITSDNPRNEQPAAIVEEILTGFSPAGRAKVAVQVDRAAAIEAAVGLAGEGDLVLIAGKGHENYQIIGTTRIHFDDVEVAGNLLRLRSGR